jgi:ATP-dependent protease ClpP protease subunit
VKVNINIDGYIDKYSGFSLAQLKSIVEANPDATELELRINSEGGDVIEGFAIHDYLVSLQIPVACVVEGLCASIATVIALAAKKDKRKMYSNAKIMVHNPYWTPSAPIGMEGDEMLAIAEQLKSTETQLANFYSAKLEMQLNDVESMMASETWLTAAKALEIGFVSTIINEASATARKQLAIKALINPDKNINMTKEFSAEQKTWIESKFSSIMNLLKGRIKNQVVKLNDGTEVFVETEDGDFMGKNVYLMEDGNMTDVPAPDGEHVTEDGRTIVVSGGIVTEVKEAEDIEALKAELAAAKAELESISAAKTEAEEIKAETEQKLDAAYREFNKFKAQILNGKFEEAQGDNKNSRTPEKSLIEQTLELRNSKK